MMFRRALLLFAAVASLASPAMAHDDEATPVTACGTTITASGTYYLKDDLRCTTSFGVDVEASKVLLLLAGHTIDNGGSGYAGVLVGRDQSPERIAVFGPGTLTGSANCGLCVGHAEHVLVAGVTATGNKVGMAIEGTDPGDDVYFVFDKATDNTIGFQFVTGEDNAVAFSNCSDNKFGIVVEPTAGDITITRNACRDNAAIGIAVHSSDNRITRNKATGNGGTVGYDLADTVLNCMGNTWEDNEFVKANMTCIH